MQRACPTSAAHVKSAIVKTRQEHVDLQELGSLLHDFVPFTSRLAKHLKQAAYACSKYDHWPRRPASLHPPTHSPKHTWAHTHKCGNGQASEQASKPATITIHSCIQASIHADTGHHHMMCVQMHACSDIHHCDQFTKLMYWQICVHLRPAMSPFSSSRYTRATE